MPTRWLAVSVLERELGLTDGGQWVYALHKEVRPIAGTDDLVHLFPLLEVSESEFRTLLRANIVALGLPLEIGDSFPMDLIVAGAIGSRDVYWSSRALNWLEQGVTLNTSIAGLLSEFIGGKQGTHRDRLRASRLLAWWRRGAERL